MSPRPPARVPPPAAGGPGASPGRSLLTAAPGGRVAARVLPSTAAWGVAEATGDGEATRTAWVTVAPGAVGLPAPVVGVEAGGAPLITTVNRRLTKVSTAVVPAATGVTCWLTASATHPACAVSVTV